MSQEIKQAINTAIKRIEIKLENAKIDFLYYTKKYTNTSNMKYSGRALMTSNKIVQLNKQKSKFEKQLLKHQES